MGISPFSSEFSALTQPQIMWALSNYYKDESEDYEKYKMICRFVNPEAAREVWKVDVDESVEETENEDYLNFLESVQKHTKHPFSQAELADRISNPDQYDVDTIERIS